VLRDGRVRVVTPDASAAKATDPARLVFEEDVVLLDGTRVVPRTVHHYLMLNKPAGVTSTTASPERERDLSEFLREMPRGVFPVGRLDRDTTGLLLFTTDGDLATSVLRPDHGTDKIYWLWLDERLEDDDPRLGALISGVPIPGGWARATGVRVLARSPAFTELLLTLTTGMKRQIRRMCFALGLKLVHLHRKRIGTLDLEDLPVGGWRELEAAEVEAVWRDVGGRERVLQRRIEALARDARQARERGAPVTRLEGWLLAHETPLEHRSG
jgi:pseudouridine synthase